MGGFTGARAPGPPGREPRLGWAPAGANRARARPSSMSLPAASRQRGRKRRRSGRTWIARSSAAMARAFMVWWSPALPGMGTSRAGRPQAFSSAQVLAPERLMTRLEASSSRGIVLQEGLDPVPLRAASWLPAPGNPWPRSDAGVPSPGTAPAVPAPPRRRPRSRPGHLRCPPAPGAGRAGPGSRPVAKARRKSARMGVPTTRQCGPGSRASHGLHAAPDSRGPSR